MPKLRTNILDPCSAHEARLHQDCILTWNQDLITSLRPFDPALDQDSEDHRDCVALPGLIDLHVHLSQFRARGHYEPALLPWLRDRIFPEEARSRDPEYAKRLSREFFQALFEAGTTTSVIYTAPFKAACEIAFETAAELGARAFIGMTLMDQNSPESLNQSTSEAYEHSVELFERYDSCTPLLNYIFTPRFAPTCSLSLMQKIARYASQRQAFVQTHLAENRDELAWVKEIFGQDTYTEVYEKAGLLSERTLLAHCIHLSDRELDILKANDCKVIHCPDSNFYLKSGEFDYRRIEEKGLAIGLGSDVGAGTSVNMLYHAKMANFRQSRHPLLPARLFYHLTLGNARILGLQDRIGSLAVGKQADLCLLGLPEYVELGDNLLSDLVFWGHECNIRRTVINGKTVFQT